VSQFYLPLNSSTVCGLALYLSPKSRAKLQQGIFGMSIIPQHTHWWWFLIVLALLSLFTTLGMSYLHLFDLLNKALLHSNLFEKQLVRKLD
jgi:hypothetical protein